MKNKNKKRTVVVKVEKPKRKRRGGGGTAALTAGFSPTGRRAAVAAINPFHPLAEGCADITEHIPRSMMRLPIPFGTKVTTNSSGKANFVLLPSLYCSGLIVNGTFGVNTNFVFNGDSNGSIQTTPGEYAANTTADFVTYGGLQAAPALFATQAATYRVVRWGVIIKTLPNMSSNQGRIRIAKISPYGMGPMTNDDWTNYLGDVSNFNADLSYSSGTATKSGTGTLGVGNRLPPYRFTAAQLLSDWGVPVTDPGSLASGAGTFASKATVSSNSSWSYEDLARLPTNFSSTINGLQAQALLVRGKANGPNPLRGTRLTARSAGSSLMEADTYSYNSGSTGTLPLSVNLMHSQTPVDASVLSMDGHDGIVISIDSAAVLTDILDIEIVYHIESTYRGQATSMFMRSCATPAAVSPADHGKLVALDQKAAHYVGVPHHFKESLRGMVEGLGRGGASRAVSALTDTISGVLGRSMARMTLDAGGAAAGLLL